MTPFVHLHVHTCFSLLDGMVRIGELCRRVKELGMSSVAITDHGSSFGWIDFARTAEQNDIHPVLGVELYVSEVPRSIKEKEALDRIRHLVLLAETEQGRKNILRLITLGHTEGFYRKPRVDFEDLENHSEGIIALTACLKGLISWNIHSGVKEKSEGYLKNLLDIYGRDHLYLELMDHGLAEQAKVNGALFELSKRYSIPLAATNDVHYLDRKNHADHEVFLAVQTATSIDDPQRMSYGTDQMYLKSPQEMNEIFGETPEVLRNTVEIAERCRATIDFESLHLPDIEPPNGRDLDSSLKEACWEGLHRRGMAESTEAQERLAYELQVIIRKGLAGYFLIVSDIAGFAVTNGISLGAGRGSAAGSLVSYVLGITDVDPLKHKLYFERFLNPERKGLPDIDIDIGHKDRDSIFEYLCRKYGQDRVAHIATLDAFSARSVIRDVGRSLNLPYGKVDRLAKRIPFSYRGLTLEQAVQADPELKKRIAADKEYQEIVRIGKEFEGLPRHASIHAAGVVIADGPLTDYTALQLTPKEELITQATMEPIEAIGLLKIDLLGLRFLSVIQESFTLICSNTGQNISVSDIPMDDPATYALLAEGETEGLFQVESAGFQRLLKKLKPENLEDVIAALSLYRPGPLGGGVVDTYIERRHGRRSVEYIDPALEEVLGDTYGVIVYQEQVMEAARRFAGYTLGEADRLRRAMSKKLIRQLKGEKERFIKKAMQQGKSTQIAEKVFTLLSYFGGYGFNKAHSTGYAVEVVRTAWLKTHYFSEYWVCLLNNNLGFSPILEKWLNIAKRKGFNLLLPDVNKSDTGFTLEDRRSIRIGLSQVKKLGYKGCSEIITQRNKHGEFKSLQDFIRRIDSRTVTRRSIENMIKIGAFDWTGARRTQMAAVLPAILKKTGTAQKKAQPLQPSLFPQETEVRDTPLELPDLPEFSPAEMLELEKEILELYVSGHPLDPFREKLKESGAVELDILMDETSDKKIKTAGIFTKCRRIKTKSKRNMAFCTLEDGQGMLDAVLFPEVWKNAKKLIDNKIPVRVKGKLEINESGRSLIVDEINPLEK